MTIAFNVFWMSLYICKNSGSRSALPNVLVSIKLKATCTGTHSESVIKSQSRWIDWRIAVGGSRISCWARLVKRERHTFNGLGFPRVITRVNHRRRIPLAPVVPLFPLFPWVSLVSVVSLASRVPLIPLVPVVRVPICISRPFFLVFPVWFLIPCA